MQGSSPLFQRHVPDILGGAGNANDIRQNINGAKRLNRLLRHSIDLIFPGDIHLKAFRLPSPIPDPGHHLVFQHLLRCNIADRYHSPLLCKSQGKRFCVPSGRTGYDGYLSLQYSHLTVLLH